MNTLEQDYFRTNQLKNRMDILGIFDHSNRMFNIRAEHDTFGKDSLGSYYMGAVGQMKRLDKREDYNQNFHYVNTARYLVENIDKCEQVVLMTFDCDTSTGDTRRAGRDLVRDTMKDLRKLWKTRGYSDMTTYNISN